MNVYRLPGSCCAGSALPAGFAKPRQQLLQISAARAEHHVRRGDVHAARLPRINLRDVAAPSTFRFEQQLGALVEIDHNSIAAGDAAAGDAAGNQAEMTATADSAATAAPDKQPEPEEQAAASAAALQPMESQAEMQAEHEGQEGHGERQEQCVAPRRAAPAEPHKP